MTGDPAEPFGRRLADAIADRGPLCAGIDPSAALLEAWGLPDSAVGVGDFGRICVDALADVAAVLKPQVAFFERHGAAGLAALEELLARARAAGVLVIADAKRGDIGSTSEAYAAAWLGAKSPLRADAVTVTPYMGLGALEPFVQAARTGRRGLFVVVRGSNPEGRPIQEATMAGGTSVEDGVLAEIAARNRQADPGGTAGPGDLGAVVGATLEPSAFDLAGLGGPVLAPGVGAQGAGPADLRARFGTCPPGTVLANVSRAVLAQGPRPDALREAARRLAGEMAQALE